VVMGCSLMNHFTGVLALETSTHVCEAWLCYYKIRSDTELGCWEGIGVFRVIFYVSQQWVYADISHKNSSKDSSSSTL
jgi:hypothetical protein